LKKTKKDAAAILNAPTAKGQQPTAKKIKIKFNRLKVKSQ
jgi:hypothetical protein